MTLTPPQTIVCGIDGSARSRSAARLAGSLARALTTRLTLAHVVTSEGTLAPAPGGITGPIGMPTGAGVGLAFRDAEAVAARSEQVVTEALGDVDTPGAVGTVLPFGEPARRLAALAEDAGVLLLVTGTRDQRPLRGALLGSVSGHLVADAPCPVLLVGPGAIGSPPADGWRGRPIVCGIDGSEGGERGAAAAAVLATRLGSPLVLVQVVDGPRAAPPYGTADLDELRRAAARGAGTDRPEPRLDVRHERRDGDPAEQLEQVAAAAGAALIVVGTRGRPPWRAAVLGSVSRDVLGSARRPVLVVPPGARPLPA